MELDEQYYGIWDSTVEVKKHRHKSETSTKVLRVFCFLSGNHANNVFLQVKEVYFSAANSTSSTQIEKDK